MPNGRQKPYRWPADEPPSPAHTSDSEDTCLHKDLFAKERLVQWVVDRWQYLVRRRKARFVKLLDSMKLLQHINANLRLRIYEYL